MKSIKKNRYKIEVLAMLLMGVILLLMSFYYLNENIYIEGRDKLGEGRIIDKEKEGYFREVPILIYKNDDFEYVFSKADIWGKFNIGDTHQIIYKEGKPLKVIIRDDYMSRFFNFITLFIAGIIFNFLSLRFLKKEQN